MEKRKESEKLIRNYEMKKNKINASFKKKMRELRYKINETRKDTSALKRRFSSESSELTSKLLKDYAQNKIVIVNNLKKRCRSCSQELTFFVENKGDKAIRAIDFDLHYNLIQKFINNFELVLMA